MQDCSKYDIMISTSLDGTLNKKDARELEKHLASCADCRKYKQLLETIRDGLREDLPDPPEALREGIMYKVGLEKHRKLHFGALGRWTAIAAVLCVVIFGVVNLNGSGVMKSAAPEAAPASLANNGGTTYGVMSMDAQAEEESAQDSILLDESKVAVKSPGSVPAEAPEPTVSAAGGSGASGEYRASNGVPETENGPEEPLPGSVYMADSLPGYERARAALDGGDCWGVFVFYGGLPEGLDTSRWQTKIPEDGEKARWLLSAEELQTMESGAAWDEFYYGDRDAGQGLVIVIAGEEE